MNNLPPPTHGTILSSDPAAKVDDLGPSVIPQLRPVESRCVKPAIAEWSGPSDAEMLDWMDTEAGQLRFTNEDFYGMKGSFRELIRREMAKGGGK